MLRRIRGFYFFKVLYSHNHNQSQQYYKYIFRQKPANTNTTYRRTQKHRQLFCFMYGGFIINLWLRFFDTRRETQFLEVFRTILCNGREFNCMPPWSNVNLQLDGRTSTSQHDGRTQFLNTMVGTQLLHTMVGTQVNLLSKSSKFSAYLFCSWHHPHSSLISCLGFIMTMVIVISFARKCKPHQLTPHLSS